MSGFLMLLTIFLPLFGGFVIVLTPIKSRKVVLGLSLSITIIAAILAWTLILNPPTNAVILFRFIDRFSIAFKIDGMSRVFAGLISSLWPFAVLYSFEYMEHEANENTLKEKTFFGGYVITFGVTLAISMSANMLTMYCFYEMLTLVTIPLILFTMTKEAIKATRLYIIYSLGGAAFAFIAFIFLTAYANTIDFSLGGVLNLEKIAGREDVLRVVYILAFFGFGVKAAIFPVCSWLPKAGVAPTPVTALLHAVAVVKSGAFAIIRLTYYSFGVRILKGTFAQYIPMAFAIFTIVYGCSMAVKERHIKRRFAYSTISNLSYVLFAALLMTPLGMTGALTHMVFHGVMKIASFFCAGAVIVKAHKTYVYELEGFGKKMPKTFFVMTVSALALMGVPGLCGFISKWQIAKASIDSATVGGYIGLAALLISALLTAIYMLQILIRAYFPTEKEIKVEKCDPSFRMLVPLYAFTIAMVVLGAYSTPLVSFFEKVAGGMM